MLLFQEGLAPLLLRIIHWLRTLQCCQFRLVAAVIFFAKFRTIIFCIRCYQCNVPMHQRLQYLVHLICHLCHCLQPSMTVILPTKLQLALEGMIHPKHAPCNVLRGQSLIRYHQLRQFRWIILQAWVPANPFPVVLFQGKGPCLHLKAKWGSSLLPRVVPRRRRFHTVLRFPVPAFLAILDCCCVLHVIHKWALLYVLVVFLPVLHQHFVLEAGFGGRLPCSTFSSHHIPIPQLPSGSIIIFHG